MLRLFARSITSIPTFSGQAQKAGGETTSEGKLVMKLVRPFISVQSIFSTLNYRRSRSEIPKRFSNFCFKDFKADLTRDDSQRRVLAQHRVQTLKQCCSLSKRCRNNVVTLCCAKNRRCKSSHVTSP